MEKEIIDFATAIGATEFDESEEHYAALKKIFRERNYFRHKAGFLIIKISRSKKPFYGLTKEILDFLEKYIDYKVILLKPSTQGWVFNREEVNENIKSKIWNLDRKGNQYKINMPLPDSNHFMGPKGCLKKLGAV